MPRISLVLAAIGIFGVGRLRAARFERYLQDSEDGESRRGPADSTMSTPMRSGGGSISPGVARVRGSPSSTSTRSSRSAKSPTPARTASPSTRSRATVRSGKPVTMFDTKTLALIKTIDVQGNPDGICSTPFNAPHLRLQPRAPNATVIDAKDGSMVGTIELGGAPSRRPPTATARSTSTSRTRTASPSSTPRR